MAEDRQRIDPTDIAGINEQARAWSAGAEPILPIDIGHIIIEHDGIDALTDVVGSLSKGGRTLAVMDHTAMSRGGDDLKSLVEAALGRAVPLTVRRLPDDPASAFHADLDAAKRLAAEAGACAAVVSVGSGSITDVAKYARYLAANEARRSIPLVTFPTAASVTAFTSAIAVLTTAGVKRNFAAQLPDAVVCDLPTLAGAPPAMTRAGFADVLARSVAYGDWFLARQLGMDDLFSRIPGRLLEPAEQAMIDNAESIAAGDAAGVRALVEALLLAGMAMSLLNHTAPISGWEHVISHFLDMTAEGDGREPALHGGQVGAGTLVAARAYDRTWDDLDLDRLAADISEAGATALARTIEEVFGPYDPAGGLVAQLRREFDDKLGRWRGARAARRRFAERKRAGEFDPAMRAMIRSSAEVRDALIRAGAPQRFAELDKPVPLPAARTAVRYSHLVRGRFTLGDLLDHTGWLTDETAADLLDEPD